jgi:bone morphogenetic protein receptor type-1B
VKKTNWSKSTRTTVDLTKQKLEFAEAEADISVATSGSRHAELIQRTIARDLRIDYTNPIGQGRYGVVWKAKWNDELVAVKSFFTLHESSWLREIEIYQTPMLRHANILGFIAADIKGSNSVVNMLLVTEYQPFGSLYDYLLTNTIDYETLLHFAYSIINGLNHLHTEIISNNYKPAIAHRDLKSKNILVKSTLACCIGDFGLAVSYNSQLERLDCVTNRVREGSHRFMAPECLSETLDIRSIDELKRTDIYSYAIVLWELVKRYSSK